MQNSEESQFGVHSVDQMFTISPGIDVHRNALSWYTRDGRQPRNKLLREEEQLFQEHLDFLSRKKTINVERLENMEFKVSYFTIANEMIRELNIPKGPRIHFSNLNGMPPQLGENIKNLRFDYLTPIQKVVIPYMQNGKDVVGCAETGSGKTIAYLFPLIGNMLVKGTPINPFLPQSQGEAFPLSLVLVPTRELAVQVYKESKKLCYKTGINTVCVYGGTPIERQISDLREGCDILIATPGRLLDLIRRRKISLRMVSTLILDEADRMLDMGFEKDLREIVHCDMPDKGHRQNLMFSATFSEDIKMVALTFLKDFFFVQPKNQAPKSIKQELIKANEYEKPKILCDILRKTKGSVIIFMDTKKGVDELSYNLRGEGFKVVSFHGDKDQSQRQNVINCFKNEKVNILVATDIASRGLDFPNVSCVINYVMPKNIDDYIHRIGRTGRIGQEGRAVSFINESCRMIFKKLYNLLKEQNQEVPQWFEDMYNNSGGELGFHRTMPWNTGGSRDYNDHSQSGNDWSQNKGSSWGNNNNDSWGNSSSWNDNKGSSWNDNKKGQWNDNKKETWNDNKKDSWNNNKGNTWNDNGKDSWNDNKSNWENNNSKTWNDNKSTWNNDKGNTWNDNSKSTWNDNSKSTWNDNSKSTWSENKDASDNGKRSAWDDHRDTWDNNKNSTSSDNYKNPWSDNKNTLNENDNKNGIWDSNSSLNKDENKNISWSNNNTHQWSEEKTSWSVENREDKTSGTQNRGLWKNENGKPDEEVDINKMIKNSLDKRRDKSSSNEKRSRERSRSRDNSREKQNDKPSDKPEDKLVW